MTARWPVGCLSTSTAVTLRPKTTHGFIIASRIGPIRRYQEEASKKANAIASTAVDPVKSALTIIESNAKADPINPPRSTLPPILSLPTRGDQAAPIYWFQLGRAYGTFYKDGVKAVWFNWKAAGILKERLKQDRDAKDVTDAVAKQVISRSEFQLLARNSHDIGKLPIFGLLALVFGEWLVLLVPFVPNRVPGTCRIPKQVEQMRLKAEERRRTSFRQGITEPSQEQLLDTLASAVKDNNSSEKWPIAFDTVYRDKMVSNLRPDQLLHLSSTLGLHNNLWDRFQLPPPTSLLRRVISRRLEYLTQDDKLLLSDGGQNGASMRLTSEELYAACEQRGIDILGKKEGPLRESLDWWLKRQQEDSGSGRALFTMLFRRLAIREWVTMNVNANS